MQNRLLLFLASFSLTLLFFGCNDDPTSLGSNLIPNQDLINATKVNSVDGLFEQKSKFYDTDSLALTGATKLFLGKNDNVESTMLMKFYMFFPDSIIDGILGDSLRLISSSVEMHPFYVYGDKNNAFDFKVHEITSDWNSLEFGKIELNSLSYEGGTDVSSNRVNDGDSVITFDLEKDLVEKWMALAAEETQEDNYGIYFDFTSNTNKILGFPAISTLYDSVLTSLKLIVEVPNNYRDTLTVQVTSDVHVALGSLPVSSNKNIFLQGGIPVRADLFIDVSSIPENSIINKATLKLFVDDSESKIGTIPTSFLRVVLLEDYDLSEVNTGYTGINLELDDANIFSGEITNYVQEWISNGNNGMKLFVYDEFETVNKVAIFGSENSNVALRPYLEIIYTSKN